MSERARSTKVGIFVLAALVLATIAVFLIGENRRMWDSKVKVVAPFSDVMGLKPGSMVRRFGIDVGQVSRVFHSAEPSDKTVYVELAIAKKDANRVFVDSEARVVNKGVLGDKMIELVGGGDKRVIQDGDTIASEVVPKDFSKAFDRIDSISQKAEQTIESVRKASEQLADPRMAEDLRGSVKAMRVILEGVAEKDGIAHKAIFDEESARRMDRILANLDATTQNLAAVSADARSISERAKTGPGLVHTLVYDDKLAESTAGTVAEVHGALKAVRTGDGVAHSVVYGDGDGSGQKTMQNLAAMTDDLKKVTRDIRAGRGTIGGLLVDPSVYEDLKGILGNVERNQVLRALVRYSIKQNEERADQKDTASAK